VDAEPSCWFSTNHGHSRLSPAAARLIGRFGGLCQRALPTRVSRHSWVRYQIDISRYACEPADSPAVLTPISDEFMQQLEHHPWRNQPQIKTAMRLWRAGLHGGYVWFRDEQPLCLQWLLTEADNPRLRQLPDWAGMYPPLAAGCGQLENILTLPAGLRYPGGAGGPFAYAMYSLAATRGISRLITHISESNGAARQWAERTGWTPYGVIHRYNIDLPLVRQQHFHVHGLVDPAVAESMAMPRRHSLSGRR
jgi:hypothetical protein